MENISGLVISEHNKSKRIINIEIEGDNDYIDISIVDNGIGIKDTSKIMTPYFTTKKNGTGLGLPIVNKIINEHKGEMTITSLKTGAKVQILFPVL